MLRPTVKEKDTLKKYKELWNKIIDLITSVINKSENYEMKLLTTRFTT